MAQENTQEPLNVPAISIDDSLEVVGSWTENYLFTAGTLIEILLLAVILLAAFVLRRLAVPRIDKMLAGEALLPSMRYTLHCLVLVVSTGAAALLAWIAHGATETAGLDGELLRIAANLLTAWVVIRLATSVLHQPGWAKLLTAVVWFVAALAILGWLQAFLDLLNSVAFNIGELRLSLMGFVNGILLLTIFIWLSNLLARLVDFGDSSVDFELRVWVSDPQQGLVNVASQIRLAIWDLFHQHGIEFPFPQRDLHIVSAEGLTQRKPDLDDHTRPAADSDAGEDGGKPPSRPE